MCTLFRFLVYDTDTELDLSVCSKYFEVAL